LLRIDITYDNNEAVLADARRTVERYLSPRGLRRVGQPLLDNGMCSLFYELNDPRIGVNPTALHEDIVAMNDDPTRYRIEGRLVPDSSRPSV
jgi:hypothetical protein